MDWITYSEDIRQSSTACAQTFWDFVVSVYALPEIRKKKTGPEIVSALGELGVTYIGKKVNTSVAKALQAVGPFTEHDSCSQSYRFMLSFVPEMGFPTLLMRTCQLAVARRPKNACAKGFERAENEDVETLRFLFETLRVLRIAGDLPDGEASLNNLTGQEAGKIALVHLLLKKKRFS